MKKNMKKFASLMLALVMAIGLAAPAFAAPADVEPAANIKVTLKLVGKNADNTTYPIYDAGSVTIGANKTVYDLVTQYFPKDKGSETSDGSEWDAYGASDYLQTIWFNGKEYATKGLENTPKSDDKGKPLTFEEWKEGKDGLAWRNGYGLLNHGAAGYEYYYAGNAWVYEVFDAEGEAYDVKTVTMNQFRLTAGDQVVLTYAVQTSRWTQPTPLYPTFPFLPVDK